VVGQTAQKRVQAGATCKKSLHVQFMKIAIDIGHAEGTGALGNGLEEHAVATKIGTHLAVMLEEMGHKTDVIDFPKLSNSDDLNKTIKAANEGCYELGISIHCDCSDNPNAHGAHVCYYSASGQKAAKSIADRLCRILPGRAEETVKRENLAVLKQTKPVWVLVECGFISNFYDAEIMRTAPNTIAQQIALGIKDYLQ
jgi:N-acetylmuramoyl-L-alanine amidase